MFEIVIIRQNTYSDAERRLTPGVKPRDGEPDVADSERSERSAYSGSDAGQGSREAGRAGSEASPFESNKKNLLVLKLLEYK